MTTTAATTSASPSTSNDSPIQDNNGASEPTVEQQQNQQQQQQQQQSSKQPQQANTEQKRPMNAFLLFCKRQRSLVREKHPNLENRSITKILGDCWSRLDKEQKSKYTDLARQHKEAFMKANPDFKWCKTPMTSNNNNNTNTINSNSNDCYATNNTRHTESSTPSAHIVDIVQSNSRDTLTNSRQSHEAPKPPKKRFLERNDSIYTTNNKNSIQKLQNNDSPNSHAKDGVVPYISLDQDTLDRVIDEAFSEKSNNNPSGINMCKCSNRISNLTSSSSVGANPTTYSTTTSSSPPNTTSTTSSSTTTTSSSSYSNSVDEPVDFSMNRTINATRQQIINNLVEKMLSAPTDNNASSTFKMNGTDSVQSQPGLPLKRENPEDI